MKEKIIKLIVEKGYLTEKEATEMYPWILEHMDSPEKVKNGTGVFFPVKLAYLYRVGEEMGMKREEIDKVATPGYLETVTRVGGENFRKMAEATIQGSRMFGKLFEKLKNL